MRRRERLADCSRDRVCGHRVRVRQQVGVRPQDGPSIIAEVSRDDVERDGWNRRQRKRRARVAQNVEGSGRDACRLAV